MVLLLLGCAWTSCTLASRLITFGDSITDNGNGTNAFVQAYFSHLLGQNVTAVRSSMPDYTCAIGPAAPYVEMSPHLILYATACHSAACVAA
jgi:hypothetical protein